ncbi:MAG TPA: hypothetical protein PLG56_00135 [Lacunisphaera sp.]|nr:hypothetical protein [Lacunisphaera sp.]
MSVKITKDSTSAVFNAVRALTKTDVLIGIPESAAERGDDAPITNAAIGYINEFGSPALNIPPRPHLAPGVKEATGKMVPQLRAAATVAIEGNAQEVDRRLNAVGILGVSGVKAKITAGLSPGLSTATLHRRQHRKVAPRMGTQPLIDTGDYMKHLTYVLRAKGKAK